MTTANVTPNTIEQSSQPELLITRLFDTPRELVFAAWTEPEHLERWQGAPQGFTVVSHDVDLRTGGTYRICMRSEKDADLWLQGEYREVVKPERLVFTHVWADGSGKPGRETIVEITFADRAGKTEFTLRQTGFASVESRDGHKLGWTSQIDRFAQYLARS